MKTLCEVVGDRIRVLLEQKKMNVNQLILNSGVLNGTMYGILQNKNKSVDLMTVIKIAGGFEMSLIDFLNDKSFDEDNLRV